MTARTLMTLPHAAPLFALCTLFGVMHSPLLSGGMYLPWQLLPHELKYVAQYSAGYALVALMLAVWGGHLWFHGDQEARRVSEGAPQED